MFPLRDENPTLHKPVTTVALIALNIAAWFFLQGMGRGLPLARSFCELALIPGDLLGLVPPGTVIELGPDIGCELSGHRSFLTLFTHMFLHGGWLHIIGNMWFLWIFGDNVEDVMGPLRFCVFYLVCGLAAATAQILAAPGTTIPMVGASGAIGGVMGAYVRLYPKARIITLLPLGFYVTTIAVPAIAMLGYWFILQVAQGVPALGSQAGGVAFWAHAGGFLAGLILVRVFYRNELLEARRTLGQRRSPWQRWR